MSKTREFNAADFPLVGHRLIEASAGTGKTYNIANLYLRLVVGDGCLAKSVDQILVVTFTRAATNELRGRIREKVEQALHVFRGQDCQDPFIQILLQRMAGSQAECATLLNNALLRMDEACIFTIHGFAVRAIQTFLFETGALADVEISEAGNARKELLLADLWRQFHLSPDEKLRKYVSVLGFKSREDFSRYFYKKLDQVEISPDFEIVVKGLGADATTVPDLLHHVDRYVAARIKPALEERARLLQAWAAIIEKAGVDEVKRALGDSGNSKLFDKIQGILESERGKVEFPSGKMMERMQALHDSASHEALPEFIRSLSRHISNSIGDEECMRSGFRALLLQYINARMSDTDLSAMQLDEVIGLISAILRQHDEKASLLRSVITSAYPVCMVDEFQDTDPAQFEMFNLLYEDHPEAGFFMIGDPKQSIYQFRGADIFSYLNVRQSVKEQETSAGEQHIFTLDTNYRSKSALVAATNCLFNDGNSPSFLYPGIDYVSVQSCEDKSASNSKGEFRIHDGKLSSSPLVFVGNDAEVNGDEKFNGTTLRWKFATDTAQRIARLMAVGAGGTIQKSGKAELPVMGGDIAVLVRTGREAACVREALLAQVPPIGSVYQSQNDSVFQSSCIAEDIYHILCAMDEPGDKGLLKKAMVTLLYRGFALDFNALDAMNSDVDSDEFFEQSIAEFSEYRLYWDEYGILAAINHMLQQRGLLQKLAQLPECDRLVTDLRHLGELLQTKSQECSSREQLILWFARQMTDDSELDESSKRIRLESDDNLVKIVTIHVSKGLEYPIVFLPFFFMPWLADDAKNIPLFHPEPAYQSRVDFSAKSNVLREAVQKEMLAEDMRLLYVAITRAIYQCYIGISAATHYKTKLFPLTCWAHLLDMQNDAMPGWPVISSALQRRFGERNTNIDYKVLFDARRANKNIAGSVVSLNEKVALQDQVSMPSLVASNWIITSYSSLAHARKEPGQQRGGYDEQILPSVVIPVDDIAQTLDGKQLTTDIRFRLPGGARTGDCLHKFFEELSRAPDKLMEDYAAESSLLHDCLRQYGLDKPDAGGASLLADDKQSLVQAQWRRDISAWMHTVLDASLAVSSESGCPLPSLRELFVRKSALPELGFDLSLGGEKPANIINGINVALRQSGLDGVSVPRRSELAGILTGSIDLLFIHDKKVYVLDYKSNTLGQTPHYYDRSCMEAAMKANRFDLQYLIYSVAAHRYMQRRLGDRYAFDGGEYSFGGVFYLFMRGMGLQEYPYHGIFFNRPARQGIEMLDAAFSGREVQHA